jgi:phosphoserine aminotransferase
LAAIEDWVGRTSWVDFLAQAPETRSTTSVCLKISDPWFQALDATTQAAAAKALAGLLADEGAAFDVGAYRDAPPGLRLWAGATVETANLMALFPWLDWAFGVIKAGEG